MIGCDAGLMAAQKAWRCFSVVPLLLGTFSSQRGILPLYDSLAQQSGFRAKYSHHDYAEEHGVSACQSGPLGQT